MFGSVTPGDCFCHNDIRIVGAHSSHWNSGILALIERVGMGSTCTRRQFDWSNHMGRISVVGIGVESIAFLYLAAAM